jgi:hypothetical protein
MTLDFVKRLPEVEDAFGFSIPDKDAAGLTTLDDFYDYVLAWRFRGDPDVRLGSIAFHKTRRALMSVLRIPRDAVRPATPLSAVIRKRRRRTWRTIEKTSGLRLPMLRRPRWLVAIATLAAFVLGMAASLLLGFTPLRGGVAVGLVFTGMFGYALCRLTEFVASEFPPDVATVADLAKAILARNYRPIAAEAKRPAADAEVRRILQHVFAEPFALPPNLLNVETGSVEYLCVS